MTGFQPGRDQRLLLVVCTGNICRSPMAQALLSAYLEKAGLLEWQVESRGVHAVAGHPATAEAVRAVADLGLDLRAHRGRQFTEADARQASLVLTLETWQRDALRQELLPAAPDTVQLLTHYDPLQPDRDIADPYGFPYRVYLGCREEIEQAVRSVVRHLQAGGASPRR